MAQQAPLEPGNPLYEFALSIDPAKSQVPEKLRCKHCDKFMLNGFKAACCDNGICESCNTAAQGGPCPFCKHSPLVTSASKALRGTARNYLKTQMATAEASKATEVAGPTSSTLSETPVPLPTPDISTADAAEGQENEKVEQLEEKDQASQAVQEQNLQSELVLQSIEEPRESSRRPTLDSTEGNDPDDDIEINVGPDYDFEHIPKPADGTPVEDLDQWHGDQQYFDKPRTNSNMPSSQPPNHSQNQSFNNNSSFNNTFDQSNYQMPPEAQMPQFMDFMNQMNQNGMNPNNMSLPVPPNQMQQQMVQMMQQMQSMPGMMNQYPHMMNMMNMTVPSFGFNGMVMPGNNFNNLMNNGAGFNNNQQQYQQNYQNGNFPFNRHNSFDRGFTGRGRNKKFRGRGAAFNNQFQHQDPFGPYNNMAFPNQYNQGPSNHQQNHYDNNQQGTYQANNDKDNDHQDDNDEFAPGGQDEVQEALGDSYNKKVTPPAEPVKEEEPQIEVKEEDYQPAPSPPADDPPPVVESPQVESKEEYIPEAYREDLNHPVAPPTAPSGPSAKDVPFRARGHGRFPSRGRGSYQGSNGYPPRSPARPVSQQQNASPTTNHGSGVVGAPTGPRAMREKDVPAAPTKAVSRSESDVGFKIRGTASQVRDQRVREEEPRSTTPQSAYNDLDTRDRDSRRYAKSDRKLESSRYEDDVDDHDDRNSRRRKSRHYEDDYNMDDADYSHSRSESYDRTASRKEGRRDRDKPRDKYSESKSKYKSSRRHEEDQYEEEPKVDYYDDTTRSKSKKHSKPHDEREERKDRDYERAEKDKHRKRSRHDRDREDEYEDEDEEESRRRSRKHKSTHRKEREREDEKAVSTDLGMRITGRSSNHRPSEVTTPAPVPDKDPHTLERERRNQERMEKEQQRRQQAAAGKLSGGRSRQVKYEDDLDRQYGKTSSRRR